MAEKKNFLDRLRKIDNNLEKEIYDTDANFNSKEKKIDELLKDLGNINQKYTKSSGKNLLEFLTTVEMNPKGEFSPRTKGNIKTKENIENKLKEAMSSIYFEDEKQRFSRYEDYRLIDAYISQLAKVLDLFRDCIMSPDDITKKSLNYYFSDILLSGGNSNSEDKETAINTIRKNIEYLDREYNISRDCKENIREALKLGDLFTIILDIREATGELLKEDDILPHHSSNDEEKILTESMIDIDSGLLEIFKEDIKNKPDIKSDKKELAKLDKDFEKAKKDIIDSINKNVKFYRDPKNLLSEINQIENENNTTLRDPAKGLNIVGSIVKVPSPENMIKIEIDGHCFGYIYIERSLMGNSGVTTTVGGSAQTISNVSTMISNTTTNDVFNARYDFIRAGGAGGKESKTKYDILSDIFVKGISKKIDKKFINKNQDFKRVIYDLLREDYILNKQINITFLEPDQVFHFKLNSNDVYGVSLLAKSLFSAKLYLATLITNLMQKVSRGRDKRAFYIDTGIDDDIEGVVQGFIRDIKSKEITSDSLKSITTILNSIGAFEDYFIPTIDGNKPIEIDTVSGMDVDVDNDFLDNLLKNAVSGTGVPNNYIDASEDVEFARSLAMQNQTFVRNIIGLQNDFGDYYTSIIRRLYYNEFIKYNNSSNDTAKRKKKSKEIKNLSNINIDDLYVKFPSPIYLSLGNLNDQISNASSTLDFITTLYFPDNMEDQTLEQKRNEFKKKACKEYFLSTMEWSIFDKVYDEIITNSAEDNIKKSLENNDSTGDIGGTDDSSMSSSGDDMSGSDDFDM